MTNIDAQIEAAARAICTWDDGSDWNEIGECSQSSYRVAARMAIAAACPNTALLELAALPPLGRLERQIPFCSKHWEVTIPRCREKHFKIVPGDDRSDDFAKRTLFATEAEAAECIRRMAIVRGVEV